MLFRMILELEQVTLVTHVKEVEVLEAASQLLIVVTLAVLTLVQVMDSVLGMTISRMTLRFYMCHVLHQDLPPCLAVLPQEL